MIFYSYDEKTKEYTGIQNAFIDPLETKKQGKNVYLVPPNATDKKPLDVKENQAVIFNGSEWEVVADYRGKTYYIGTEQHEMKELGDLPNGATFEPVEPEKTLSELKSEKLNELNTIASRYDSYKCNDMYITSSVGGYRFNADSRSQTNLRGLISVLDDVKSIAYKDYDNEFQSLNKEQMQIIFSECILNGQNLYKQKWDYAEKIKTCETIEELNSIEFNFTMMNFS